MNWFLGCASGRESLAEKLVDPATFRADKIKVVRGSKPESAKIHMPRSNVEHYVSSNDPSALDATFADGGGGAPNAASTSGSSSIERKRKKRRGDKLSKDAGAAGASAG